MALNRLHLTGLSLFSAGMLLVAAHPAAALTTKECSAKYQAAKTAGTLNGADWKAFRAANCTAATTPAAAITPTGSAPATAAPATTATATAATTAPAKTAAAPAPAAAAITPTPSAPSVAATKPTAAPAASTAAAGTAVFPDKVDPKYASLKAGSQRMKTCDDQYKLNKATNANGGMKWNQKGGGYYSACNKHLKGA